VDGDEDDALPEGRGLVEDCLRAELEGMGAPRREPGLSAMALTLAARLDRASARDAAQIAKQLRETLLRLKAACKDREKPRGRLDDLAARRSARASGPQVSQRPTEGEGQQGG
jgi:hypothetical protein